MVVAEGGGAQGDSQSRQRRLSDQEWEIAQMLAIILDQVAE
jgi:hypothetical protein